MPFYVEFKNIALDQFCLFTNDQIEKNVQVENRQARQAINAGMRHIKGRLISAIKLLMTFTYC